ncbi:DUF4249 domain-containing protein [Chitinophaga lutea]|uniref:DUF4249 domain-containing protein n=2 Tax=Chitinophaga lutea TaxID=2488634 RepID=A0A3N4Q117_9BACT|nr:DUF4249 domain-containing protein [Chitinophaga lutea]
MDLVMKKTAAFISAILLLAACEKSVHIPIPYDGDKIVVNSLMQPDSVLYIRVTRSQPPGATSFPAIRDAGVTVKAGDLEVPLQWQEIGGKGYFVSTQPVSAALRYTIQVAADGLDTVRAADTLPRRPVLADPFAQVQGNRVKFTLKDVRGKDFYRFRLYAGEMNAAGRIVPVKRLRYRFDPSYNNSFTDLITNNYLESTLIPDERFDGHNIAVVMQTERVSQPGDFLVLEVTGLTWHSWQYLKTLELQNANEGNLLVEQNRVHTNVAGGYGIFGGVNAAHLNIEIK